MNRTFLDACNGKDVEYTPVWFMRQAGRYLPSYMKLKGNRSVLDITKDPELASQAAVDAVNTLGVDAAIIFADIMLPLEGLGIDFTIVENVGPVVKKPIRSMEAVDSLERFDPSDVAYVLDVIDATVQKLDDGVPLLGFSGAPFTLAGYVIEGQPSRDLVMTKRFMHGQPEAWHALMKKITRMAVSYLDAQVRQGVDAIQLFDSWVGCLSRDDYERYVSKYTREVFASIRGDVPTIHFCADSCHLIESFHSTGPDVLSVDWRVPIEQVWERTSESTSVQGNLDPVVASTGGKEMDRQVASILKRSEGHRNRHIFSLGHGVLRETDPDNLKRVVKMVHRGTRRVDR